MGHVKRENGQIGLNPMDVLKEQVKYCSTQYCQSPRTEGSVKEVVGAFTNEKLFPNLNKEESLPCEGIINEDEAGFAL